MLFTKAEIQEMTVHPRRERRLSLPEANLFVVSESRSSFLGSEAGKRRLKTEASLPSLEPQISASEPTLLSKSPNFLNLEAIHTSPRIENL
jgi:hypothetical protein